MIAMLDTSESLTTCAEELSCVCEQLLTPSGFRTRQFPEARFAIDNGAFANFEVDKFRALLEREKGAARFCRFVSVPDIVGSARRTLEVFAHWRYRMTRWPVALVAQDGQEDIDIPWAEIDAIFIGGTTTWKLGQHAANIIRTGKLIGKWVHVGRVNTPGRWQQFEELGADSIDGSGLARYSWMRDEIYQRAINPPLFPLKWGQENGNGKHQSGVHSTSHPVLPGGNELLRQSRGDSSG